MILSEFVLQKIPDRYEEPQAEDHMAPRDEQRRWEEDHIGAAALRFGARDADRRHPRKDYEYVLEDDEMIQFVNAVQMRGTNQNKVRGCRLGNREDENSANATVTRNSEWKFQFLSLKNT